MPNEIKLYGDIGEGGITCQMVKTQLAKMDQSLPLTVRIDSFGGSVFDGLSMYDAFASYPGPKKAIIETSAFSIASYIAMAFDEVEISSNGYMMIHSPYMDGAGGTSEELANMAELGAKLKTDMVRAYSTKAGISEQDAQELMAKDTYLNAQEALAKGLVNRINETRAKPHVRPQARHQNMPHRVFASLFGSDASAAGEGREPTQENSMSESPKVVAATLSEIEAAFPKAKAESILSWLKRGLPMASVATAAVDEVMSENAALKAELEELKAAMAAKAEEEEEIVAEGEEEEQPVAKAQARGAKPVARAGGKPAKTAKAEWDAAIAAVLPSAKNRAKAVAIAARQNPGLRERMLAEVNGR